MLNFDDIRSCCWKFSQFHFPDISVFAKVTLSFIFQLLAILRYPGYVLEILCEKQKILLFLFIALAIYAKMNGFPLST
jgi:hypothetical protein